MSFQTCIHHLLNRCLLLVRLVRLARTPRSDNRRFLKRHNLVLMDLEGSVSQAYNGENGPRKVLSSIRRGKSQKPRAQNQCVRRKTIDRMRMRMNGTMKKHPMRLSNKEGTDIGDDSHSGVWGKDEVEVLR